MPTSVMSPDVLAVFEQARSPQVRSVAVGRKRIKIPTPFPSPEDWRDQWIYFLMVDRFNNPQAPPRFAPFDAPQGVFQGGTFNGIRAQLDYLRQLGVGAIWLSPVLKNCQYNPFTYHGYGIQDYLRVEPRFASDPAAAKADPTLAEEELRALVDEAHARGIYVIFDIVLNHAGDVFEYVLRMAAEPRRPTGGTPPTRSTGGTRMDAAGRSGPRRPATRRRMPRSGPRSCGATSFSGAEAGAARPAEISPRSRSWSPTSPRRTPRRAPTSPSATS